MSNRERVILALVAAALLCALSWLGDKGDPTNNASLPAAHATPTTLVHHRATIGGTDVPDELDCEEDQIIAFRDYGPPYPLVCVNIDSFIATNTKPGG